jgi:hypothetical protein
MGRSEGLGFSKSKELSAIRKLGEKEGVDYDGIRLLENFPQNAKEGDYR